MDETTYSFMRGKFAPKSILQTKSTDNLNSIRDIFDKDIYNQDMLIMAFCGDLKRILELNNINEIIENIFSLENLIERAKKDIQFSEFSWDFFADFYRNLSPLLLRAIREQLVLEGVDEECWEAAFKEALRVSIEEEIYLLTEEMDEHPSGRLI